MTTKTKCWIIEALSILIMVPGIWALVHIGAPFWVFIVTWGCFWTGGQWFVISMIGDGKEGLGYKKND